MSDETYFYEWECDEKHKKPNKCFICDVVGVKWTWLQKTSYIDREYTRFVCDDCADGDKGRSNYEIMYGPCIRKERIK